MREPNTLLDALLDEAGLSRAGLASRINQLGARRGKSYTYDHTSVGRWLAGQRPRGDVPELLCLVLSHAVGRQPSLDDVGLGRATAPAPGAVGLEQFVNRAPPALWRSDKPGQAPTPVSSGLSAIAPVWEWENPPEDSDVSRKGSARVGIEDVEYIRLARSRYELMYRRSGGVATRGRVVFFLNEYAAPVLRGSYTDAVGRQLHRAADSGALDEPIGPSPLVLDSTMGADWRTGRAPWGVDLRGDAVGVSVFQRHQLVTGLSNQGKTASLRALALWLAQDPSVELWIADLKGVGDWAMFEGLATRLIQGPTDEHVIETTHMLEDAIEEMERRIMALAESGSTEGITRAMERTPGSGFHPLVVIVDEAQVAFMCPAKGEDGRPYGGSKATSRYFMAARKLHNQGRALNETLWQGTQDPTDQNLPKLVREGAHTRASLALGTESQSRMALGDKAVDGGAAPHELRQGLDKGTLVVAGDGVKLAPGQSSVTVRTHFIGGDDAATLAERAKAKRKAIVTNARKAEAEANRDLLADLAEILGTEPVPVADVPPLLRDLAPGHKPYAGLSGKALREQLAAHGVKVASTGNRWPVDPAEIRKALALRPVDKAE